MANPSKQFELIRLYPRLTADPVVGREGEIYYNNSLNRARICIQDTPSVIWADLGTALEEAAQDRNAELVEGGSWSLSGTTLTWGSDAYIQIPGLQDGRNTIPAGNATMADGTIAYVDVNRDAGVNTNLTVSVVAVNAMTFNQNRIVIARKINGHVIIGNSMLLIDGESKALRAGVSDQILAAGGHSSNADKTGQLRLLARSPGSNKMDVTPANKVAVDGTQFGTPLKNLFLRFGGAVIRWQTGQVFAADDSTPLGVDLTTAPPSTIATGQYRWYSVTVIPSTLNGVSEITGQIILLAASADGASPTLAPKAPYAKGLQLGQVCLQNVGGTIQNIVQTNVSQNGVGGSGGSGTGDATDALVAARDHLIGSTMQAFFPNVYSQDEETNLDKPNSTGSYSIVDESYNFSAPAQVMRSITLMDSNDEFATDFTELNASEILAFWKDLTSTDASAVFALARNGQAGSPTWQNVTMSRAGNSVAFRGIINFLESEPNLALHSQATVNASTTLNASNQYISQSFVVTSKECLRQQSFTIGGVTGTPVGYVFAQIVKDNAGAPTGDVMKEVRLPAPTAAGTLTFTFDNLWLPPGTYHVVLQTDATYRASSGSNNFNVSRNSAGSGGQIYNGTTWSSASGAFNFAVLGFIVDLRLRVTSAGSNGKLSSWFVYYVEDKIQDNRGGELQREYVSFTGTNQNAFVLTKFKPNPYTLKVYDVRTGQVYVAPTFDISGQTVTFPANMFVGPGTTELVFDQTIAAADVSDVNAALMAENRLGSKDPSRDLSVAGEGILLRADNGTLVEASIRWNGASYEWVFAEV